MILITFKQPLADRIIGIAIYVLSLNNFIIILEQSKLNIAIFK